MVRFRSFLVGRGGFEPPKSKTSDLQSDPFGRSGICPYEIKNKKLQPQSGSFWDGILQQVARVSKTTFSRANHPNGVSRNAHGETKSCNRKAVSTFCGALGRNRTTDRQIYSLLLYRLSYQGIKIALDKQGQKNGDPERARTVDLQRDRLAL